MLPVPIWKVWEGTEMPIPTLPSINNPLVVAAIPANPAPKTPLPATAKVEFAVVTPTPTLPSMARPLVGPVKLAKVAPNN